MKAPKMVRIGMATMAVLGLSLTGTQSFAATNKVTLTFSWWGDPTRNLVYQGVINQFEKAYPNITIVPQSASFSDYFTKLDTELAGNNAPDIIGMHANFAADYATRGALMDLGPFAKSGVINMKGWPKSVLNSDTVDGKTYMISQGVAISGYTYNQTLFAKLGVRPPSFNWTWTDFMNDAVAIKNAFVKAGEGNGHWGTDDESGSLYPGFQYYLREHGKQLYTADGKLGFTAQDLENWFTMWAQLRAKGVIPDAATTVQYANASVQQSMLAKGLIGFQGIPFNQLYLYQDQMSGNKLNLLREPTLVAGKNGEMIAGAYLSIWSKSKHPKEAAEFINFFVNNLNAGKIFKVEQGVPANPKIAQAIRPYLEPAQRTAMNFLQIAIKLATPYPYSPQGNGQVSTDFTNTAQNIAFGKESIQQASEQFIQEANKDIGQ